MVTSVSEIFYPIHLQCLALTKTMQTTVNSSVQKIMWSSRRCDFPSMKPKDSNGV